jgi:hypothetical protein
MQVHASVETGGAASAARARIEAGFTRGRERRRRLAGRELATPLAASFLGLLLVHGLRPAAAAADDAGSATAAAPDARLASTETAPLALLSGSAEPAASVPAVAPGSVLAVGGLIDPAALTRLSGEARFAEAVSLPAAGAIGAPTLAADPAPPAPVELAPAAAMSLALPAWPALETDDGATEEDVGPIGLYRQGGDGDQALTLTEANDIFVGGDGNEVVRGLGGDDQLDGNSGDDQLEGGAGDDMLLGGTGDDRLDGGDGSDSLDGGEGSDRLQGGAGSDRLLGGAGDDRLDGGPGADRLEGGPGDDTLVLEDPRDAVTELPLGSDGGGNDTVVVADGYAANLAAALPQIAPDGRATFLLGNIDVASYPSGLAGYRQQIDPDIENIRLEGAAGHDVVADAGANVIEGDAGGNRLHGGGGDDALFGNTGDDLLDGGDGDDWLDGGEGADELYGGAGDDVFVLGLHEAADHVFDHEGRNSLRLDGADAAQLRVAAVGEDLVLSHGEEVVATLHGGADSFAGIDLGEGVRPLEEFLAADAATAQPAADWLADYLPGGAGADPLPDPWSLGDTGPAASGAAEPATAMPDLGAAGPLAGDWPAPAAPVGDVLSGADELWLPVDPFPTAPFDTTGLDGQAGAPEAALRTGGEERELAA